MHAPLATHHRDGHLVAKPQAWLAVALAFPAHGLRFH